MKIRSLSSGLKASYRGSNVSRRAQRFENWIARASSEGATTDYDHAETVREYYEEWGSGFLLDKDGPVLMFVDKTLYGRVL